MKIPVLPVCPGESVLTTTTLGFVVVAFLLLAAARLELYAAALFAAMPFTQYASCAITAVGQLRSQVSE